LTNSVLAAVIPRAGFRQLSGVYIRPRTPRLNGKR
jgi:hypothetical protein